MLCEILVDFPGSQDGSVTEQFTAGTQRELSAYLAAIVVPCGWARPVATDASVTDEATRSEAQPSEPAAKPKRRAKARGEDAASHEQ